MKGLVVEPGRRGSLRLADVPEPAAEDGTLVVSALALGVCGTDRELISGQYGEAPPGRSELVIGHESVGVVDEAPVNSRVGVGDFVVPFVHMPDPIPCDCCAAGQWDRCRNDRFTEHGIRALDGFGRERFGISPDRVIRVDSSLGLAAVLCEPASVVAKAWAVVDAVTREACWNARRVLVTGAGPVGLLAGMIGRQRGLDVHLFDKATDGPKPALARDLGATYQAGAFDDLPRDFDVVIECTAAPAIAMRAASRTAPNGVVCLIGVAEHRPPISVDAAGLNDLLVLGNRIIVGSVNANRAHYEAGHEALRRADRGWLNRLITRRVPIAGSERAFEPEPGDVKTVIVFDRGEGIFR